MVSNLPGYVVDLLDEIVQAQGIIDYRLEFKPGSTHGDNFFGVIHRITLSGWRDGAEVRLSLICKLSSTNKARRREFRMDTAFGREVLMYTKILPILQEFQRNKGLLAGEGFAAYPKCYAAVADEQTDRFVVIMEDLGEREFTMLPKGQPMPKEHIYLAIDHLARMHAVSLAIKDQQPHVYEKLRSLDDLCMKLFACQGPSQMIIASFDRAIAVLDDEVHIKWLTDVKQNVTELNANCFADGKCDPVGVIGHGDFWLTNMLFRCDHEVCECEQ